jgi:hypothetical protein
MLQRHPQEIDTFFQSTAFFSKRWIWNSLQSGISDIRSKITAAHIMPAAHQPSIAIIFIF